ncbi:MAG TPA: TIGR03943 family protein [Chthoniobacteraceae bacterium]|jgi:uncharacterized repeat protein (TIGR03943 family)|nr:TIGR03943 family protein [Chthoniobacteraceae bacterium]
MKSPLFNRWLPGVTLLAWSAVLLAYYFSGRVDNLLYPTFRIYVVIAGIAMLAMSGCFLALPGVAACCDDERCGHPLGKRKIGRLVTFMILILPITAAAMFSPTDFTAATVNNRIVITDASGLVQRGSATKVPPPAAYNPAEPPLPTKSGSPAAAQASATPATDAADQYLPKSKDGNIEVQVIDLLYAAQDSSMKADFEGKTVETIGQLMPDDSNNPSGNRFKLMRMFMWCCAADAKPIAALVEVPQKPGIAEMSWVKVVGQVDFPVEGGRTIAVLKAKSVTQVKPPEDTMLY